MDEVASTTWEGCGRAPGLRAQACSPLLHTPHTSLWAHLPSLHIHAGLLICPSTRTFLLAPLCFFTGAVGRTRTRLLAHTYS